MADYRLSVYVAKRGDGRSATAMAAYRACEVVRDERTGERFDFSRKSGLLYSEVVTPPNAPEWARDREQLWNRSEAAHRREKAIVAREIQLSLPHELDAVGRRELTVRFASHFAERYGVAVDTCIHAPNREGDQRNYHAHLLVCTRAFDESKPHGLGNNVRAFDAVANQRAREENHVETWRAAWAEMMNQALERADVRDEKGVSVEVDHRSYERRGIAQEPTIKEGTAATALRRRGAYTERAAMNDQIRSDNQERAQEIAPVAASEAITENSPQPPTGLTNEGGAPAMTNAPDDALGRLARTEDLLAEAEAFIKRRQEEARAQEIGRAYEMQLRAEADAKTQWAERVQQMDLEFEEDERRLVMQDLEERRQFDEWMRGQREAMRRRDEEIAQQNEQNLVLQGEERERQYQARQWEFAQRERLRNDAEIKAREQFAAFQEQVQQERLFALNDRNDQNHKGIDQSLERAELLQSQRTPQRAREMGRAAFAAQLDPENQADIAVPAPDEAKGEPGKDAKPEARKLADLPFEEQMQLMRSGQLSREQIAEIARGVEARHEQERGRLQSERTQFAFAKDDPSPPRPGDEIELDF